MVLRGAPAPSRCVQRRSERKKNPATNVAGFLNVQWKDQRLLNWGARRAALRPYFLRPDVGNPSKHWIFFDLFRL